MAANGRESETKPRGAGATNAERGDTRRGTGVVAEGRGYVVVRRGDGSMVKRPA